jgi:hypothetical protein
MVSEYFAETANSMTNVNARIWKLWATTNAVTNAWIPTCEIYTFERRIVQPSRPSIREANEAWAAAEGERKLARERAEMLLMENLMPAQREELKQNGYFTLRRIDEKGTRFYRIHRGRSRNVEQVTEEGRRIMTLCAHPHENVPDADTMLAQKLMLMANEQEFLRVANRS